LQVEQPAPPIRGAEHAEPAQCAIVAEPPEQFTVHAGIARHAKSTQPAQFTGFAKQFTAFTRGRAVRRR